MTRAAAARLAGFLYFATVPTTGFAYGYVTFMPHNDPAALVSMLEASRQTLEWSIFIGVVGFIDYLALAAVLHRLLAPTSKLAADLMLLLVAVSLPLSFAALAQRLDLVALLQTRPANLESEALRLLQGEHDLFQMSVIFWGLWMIPLGWLAWRSGLVPRLIGLALIAGGLGYLSTFILPLFEISMSGSTLAKAVGGLTAALTVGSEFAFMFWLMIKGAGPRFLAAADGQ